MIDCTALMSASAFADVRRRDLALLARVAVDRLLVGRFGLVHGALAFMQGIGRLVEPRLRRIAVLGQLADAVVGLLRQDHARLRALERGLARRDDLRPRADVDVGELRLGDDLGGQRLLVLGDRLGIVDPHQHRAGGDVLAARDRDLGDAPIDPRRDVEPRRVHLALHQQRLAPHQVPDRQAGDDGNDDQPTMMEGIRPDAGGRCLRCFLRRFGRGFGWSVRCRHFLFQPFPLYPCDPTIVGSVGTSVEGHERTIP